MKNLKIDGYLTKSIKAVSKPFNVITHFIINMTIGLALTALNFLIRPFLLGTINFVALAIIIAATSAYLTYYGKKETEKKKEKARGFLKDLTFSLKKENVYINADTLAQASIETEKAKTTNSCGPDRKTEVNFVYTLDDNYMPQIFEETIAEEEGKVINHKVKLYEQKDLDNPEIIESFKGPVKTFAIRKGIL